MTNAAPGDRLALLGMLASALAGRAMAVASRVVCMLEGRVVLDGPTEAMPRQKVTEAYFGVGRTEVMA